MIREYQTINTFSRNPVPAQIITYFVFIGQALTFFICMYINYKSTSRQIAILVSYIITVIAQIIITLRTSCIDPSDNIMIEYRNDAKNRRHLNIDDCLYCDICTSYVKQSSRHCKACQRCVQQFDHHCMWINNCVGSKNYKDFIIMIIVTLLNMIVYVIGMALLWSENQWTNYIGPMVAVWVFSVLVVIFSILLMNLVGLHIYLIYKGLTTYQFIMLQRQQQRKKKQEAERSKQIQLIKNRQTTINPVRQIQRIQQKINQNNRQVAQITGQQFKTQNNFKSNQNSDIIFGNNQISHESRTQKSQNQKNQSTKQKRKIKFTIQQDDQHQNYEAGEQPSSLNSKQQSQINISQFFSRNKSLKFFIGDEIGSRPKSVRNSKRPSKQNMYNSVKIGSKQINKNQSMYTSEMKNNNENNDFPQSKSSISLKAINTKQKS